MKSEGNQDFWDLYWELQEDARKLAKAKFQLWKQDTTMRGLDFKRIDDKEDIWSVHIGDHYRALCVKDGDAYIWYWIGTHEEYNGLV